MSNKVMTGDDIERLQDWFSFNLRQNNVNQRQVWVRNAVIKKKLDAIGVTYTQVFLNTEMQRLGFAQDKWEVDGKNIKVWSFCEASSSDDEIGLGIAAESDRVQ